VRAYVVNGPDIKAENTFAAPDRVGVRTQNLSADGRTFTLALEPHSLTALVFDLA
jgi:alpha-L-arabinofuranosidase